MISGFDGAVISFLLGGENSSIEDKKSIPSMEDIFKTALNQEILENIVVD